MTGSVLRCTYTLLVGLLPSYIVLLGNTKMFPLFLGLVEFALLLDLLILPFSSSSLCPSPSSSLSSFRDLSSSLFSSSFPSSFLPVLLSPPDSFVCSSIVLMVLHLFFLTGHRMTFNDVPVDAAFVGLSSFHSHFSLILTFLHVFFPLLLLSPLLLLVLLLRLYLSPSSFTQDRLKKEEKKNLYVSELSASLLPPPQPGLQTDNKNDMALSSLSIHAKKRERGEEEQQKEGEKSTENLYLLFAYCTRLLVG